MSGQTRVEGHSENRHSETLPGPAGLCLGMEREIGRPGLRVCCSVQAESWRPSHPGKDVPDNILAALGA